jgi:uncharacterized protein YndB with AHSA1/START domain
MAANTTTVTVTRTLKAPQRDVFDAWTSADSLREWFFPGAVVGEASCDPVVGGRYRVVGILPDGTEELAGEYVAVEPPHRLVFTFESRHAGEIPTVVTVTLRPGDDEGTTDMTIRHERISDERFRLVVPDGWATVLDQLESYLAAR